LTWAITRLITVRLVSCRVTAITDWLAVPKCISSACRPIDQIFDASLLDRKLRHCGDDGIERRGNERGRGQRIEMAVLVATIVQVAAIGRSSNSAC
jgi:hypothetical protein